MYIPPHYRNENEEELNQMIREHAFGLLISHVDQQLWATHIPFTLNQEGTALWGHISRGNRQWRGFQDNQEVLAVFSGPHTYISSSWYDHENVPTWNYLAVHVYGKLRIIEGEELKAALTKLVDHYEQGSERPASVHTMSEKFYHKEVRGVVGFEIQITRKEGAFKLSQTRDAHNHGVIVDELHKRGDHHSKAIAAEMQKRKPG